MLHVQLALLRFRLAAAGGGGINVICAVFLGRRRGSCIARRVLPGLLLGWGGLLAHASETLQGLRSLRLVCRPTGARECLRRLIFVVLFGDLFVLFPFDDLVVLGQLVLLGQLVQLGQLGFTLGFPRSEVFKDGVNKLFVHLRG